MKKQLITRLATLMGCAVFCAGMFVAPAYAGAPPPENPKQGSAGVQGTVPTPPPDVAATIITPTSGSSFNRNPIQVNGLCTTGLLVKMFSNNVFVGAAICVDGSYNVQIDLFEGRNDLIARIFDALDQPGPDSNVVTVNYHNDQFAGLGVQPLTLSSIYALRGANPGDELNWPIIVSGGTGPYAISVDWGDGKPVALQSEEFPGTINISHVYDTAGTYKVTVKATDKNGMTAFLQLVGQANGAVSQGQEVADSGLVATSTTVVWLPAAISIPLIISTFWLGRRYEITALRRRLEHPERK
jgi:hypothetical protein